MTLDDFHSLFAYSDTCRSLLHQTLKSLPQSAIFDTFESSSQWNSIALLLAHSIGAEERLITLRIQGVALPQVYEERAATDLDGLFADVTSIRQQTYAFLLNCRDPDLARSWEVAARLHPLADLLFHILNHENYHRGQIIMRLQMLGFDPPNFDYVLLRADDSMLAVPPDVT